MAPQPLGDKIYHVETQNGAIWTCFGSVFMIFLQNLAFSNLHNLYIRDIETVYLLYKDHTVSMWPYPNSGDPDHPSKATGLPNSEASRSGT